MRKLSSHNIIDNSIAVFLVNDFTSLSIVVVGVNGPDVRWHLCMGSVRVKVKGSW